MKLPKVAAAFALSLLVSAIGYAAGDEVVFRDQGIVKVSAKAAPSGVTFQFGDCFNVVVDRSAGTAVVNVGSETQQETMPGTPKQNGGLIALFYHDQTDLVTIIDYEQEGSDEWESVTVVRPFPNCNLTSMKISGTPSNDDFSGVRVFVTDDIKQQMPPQN